MHIGDIVVLEAPDGIAGSSKKRDSTVLNLSIQTL